MNDLGRSEAEWRRATMAAPDYRDGWRGLGEALARQGRYDELAKLAPDLLARPALRGLGLAWRAQPARARGEFSAAGALLQGAIDELPDDIDVVQACCQLLFEVGDAAECERAIGHLLSLVPDNAGAHHNLGTLYLRMGRFADAVGVLRKSIELSPKNAAAYLHLGHALVADGQRDEAVRAWADALRLEPGNRQALEALTRAGSPPADNKSQSAAPLAAVMLKPSDGYGASPTGQSLGA